MNMVMPNLDTLPHRDPFRFLSSVESLKSDDRGDARWEVTGDEEFFVGHFPGNPLVPGVLLAESLAQLSGMIAYSDGQIAGTPPAHLAQVNVKFLYAVCPPASIALHSQLIRRMGGLCLFDVQASVDDVVAAKGTVVLSHHSGPTLRDGPA